MQNIRLAARSIVMLLVLVGVGATRVAPCLGEDTNAPALLRVAVKPFEPFVYAESPTPRGFSIDLWNEVARILEVRTEFVMCDSVKALIDMAEQGQVHAAIAGVTITAERERRVDFSHPYYRSGLRIGVPLRSGPTMFATVSRFASADLLAMIGMLAGLAVVAAHLLWFIERTENPECFPHDYLAGVGEALWWSVATIITGGCENKAPVRLLGRMVAVAWMLGSIVLVAAFTATLSSQMTAETVAGAIVGPDSLPGRPVATVEDTQAEKDLQDMRATVHGYRDLAAAIAGVAAGKADAVVYDAPVLAHEIKENPRSPVRLVGPVFEHQDYGIALPPGSPHRKAINQALLTLGENGTLAELNVRWFGEKE